MSFNKFILAQDYLESSSSESSEEINLAYIIENKPDVDIVRDFMRFQIDSIIDPDEELFLK